jgi:sporulation protein YlmC with PRC-barrel domain
VPSVPDVPLVTGTIKLAEVSIKYFNTSMVDIYDARVRGGGIHKDKHIYVNRGKSVTRENINDESNNYADIGLYDGQYLRKSNVLIIKVPYSRIDAVKEDIMLTDTTITDNEAYRSAMTIIKDYIGNYVAAGTYFILVDENNEIYPLST